MKRNREKGVGIVKESLVVGRRKGSEAGPQHAICAQPERRGVSGRKPIRPRSHSGLRLYSRRQTTPASPRSLLIDDAYIHRLLLPTDIVKLKS